MIYLDHAATTPLGEAARGAMGPWLSGRFGNPSSLHRAGRDAREAVEAARATVARCLNADADEIVFTSGGTEADNLALSFAGRLAVSAVEHPAVLEPARSRGGALLGVDGRGLVDPAAVPPGTDLVSVMLVNNEVGAVQPLPELRRRFRGVLHTDAVQAVGKIPVDVRALGVDLLSLSAHKVNGPQGVGALYVRRGLSPRPAPRALGGGQEGGLRSGTENVAGIVGFAAALSETCRRDPAPVAALRDRLETGILSRIPGVRVNAAGAPRAPHLLSVSFEGIDGEAALMRLDGLGIAASSGSACSSEDFTPSHVLTAMGIPGAGAKGTLRFSLGPSNTEAEIEQALEALVGVVRDLRSLAP